MGNARWSSVDWNQHASATQSQTRSQIFTQSGIHPDLDPPQIKFRESVDSVANPASTPIIIAVDQTGSMGELAELIIKKGLGVIMKEIYDRKPVSDPHIMLMAVGDAFSDQAALQATQFEASITLADQIKKFYLEANGGGNGGESYALAWLFAAYKTKCDAIRKRKRKGYIFTIGDESCHLKITREQAQRFVGLNAEADVSVPVLLNDVLKDWHVFHLIVKPVSDQNVRENWRSLLSERAILIDDYEKLAEGIVSTIQIVEGADPEVVVESWGGDTSVVVRSLTNQLAKV